MKRGQVTLFIILGVALLILVLLFIFRDNIFGDRAANTLDEESVALVEQLVLSCADDGLERLLRKAGANGGQLDTSYLRSIPVVWDSDTIPLYPQEVPYWSHVRPCNQNPLGCEASSQPPLCGEGRACPISQDRSVTNGESLQEQLERFLPSAVVECVDGFRQLEGRLDVQQRGDPQVVIAINEEAVFATITWPLVITDRESGNNAHLEDFTSRADVALPKIYGFANDLANAERKTAFLERLTLHLLAIYGGIDGEIPPMRDVELFGKKRYWVRSHIEQLLREEILIWTSFIQVPNALESYMPIWPSTASFSQDEQFLYAGIFQYLTIKPNNITYPDLGVDFFYPDTRPYLSINGGQEVLGPRSAETSNPFSKLIGVFMNDYRFRYDIAFPVIVTIQDYGAFDGKGYKWVFGLEANINRNEPLDRNMTAMRFALGAEQVDPLAPQQRVKNTIRIIARDAESGHPVPGVRISYTCGQDFFVGETDNDGRLTTRFPYCRYGGSVLYSATDYMGGGVEFDNYREDVVEEFDLELWPLQEVELFVQKQGGELDENDMVMLGFQRVQETPYEPEIPLGGYYVLSIADQTREAESQRLELEELARQGVISQEEYEDLMADINRTLELAPAQPSVKVKLAPGNYTIDAYLVNTEPFTIPAETRSAGGSSFVLPEQNFSMWMSGGAKMNASEAFPVNAEILYAADTLTFKVLEQPIPRTWTQLETATPVDEFLKGKRSQTMPVWG